MIGTNVAHAQIRFTENTRIVLKDGRVVRPIEDRFRFCPSGDEGPAGTLVLCSLGFEEPDPCPPPGEEPGKIEAVREIYISSIAEIQGARVTPEEEARLTGN